MHVAWAEWSDIQVSYKCSCGRRDSIPGSLGQWAGLDSGGRAPRPGPRRADPRRSRSGQWSAGVVAICNGNAGSLLDFRVSVHSRIATCVDPIPRARKRSSYRDLRLWCICECADDDGALQTGMLILVEVCVEPLLGGEIRLVLFSIRGFGRDFSHLRSSWFVVMVDGWFGEEPHV